MTLTHIGLLGGSFNPPHAAHVALAQTARAQLDLARVDLMPAGLPWQKANAALASTQHRLAMCHEAIDGIEGLGVEPCETLLMGNTYTADTLRYLCSQHPSHRYSLIIGADQARRFDTWHDWQILLSLCQLVLVARNGQAALLPNAVTSHCSALGWVVRTVKLPALNVSSSDIRWKIAAGQAITGDVPVAVERYIVKHSLYKDLLNQ